MDPNLSNVAKRIADSYKWLSQSGVNLSEDKKMELATNMVIAASILDTKDCLLTLHDRLNPLHIRIDNVLDISEPISVSLQEPIGVSLQEPISVSIYGSVAVDQ